MRIQESKQITIYKDICDVCGEEVVEIGTIDPDKRLLLGYINADNNIAIHQNCLVDTLKMGDKYLS